MASERPSPVDCSSFSDGVCAVVANDSQVPGSFGRKLASRPAAGLSLVDALLGSSGLIAPVFLGEEGRELSWLLSQD